MKFLQILFAFFVMLTTANANIVISEIMYDPSQGSDTDLEWVEIYNDGPAAVDLKDWKLDGSNFDDIAINPKEYVVIARELVDGSDDDLESFEAYYGNNDGIWDEKDGNYKAVDGSMSLVDEDYILLSSDTYADSINYSSSWGGKGNGKTIYKINLGGSNTKENWAESTFDGGTPGKNKNNNGLLVKLEVISSNTEISFVTLPDDSSDAGYQILPIANENRLIQVNVEVNTQSNIAVYAELNSNKIQLNQAGSNGTTKIFDGSLQMPFYSNAGNQTINVSVTDQNKKTTYKMVDFEYLPLIASTFDIDEINFGTLQSGNSAEKSVSMKNAGNVLIDASVSGTDLVNGQDMIGVQNMQVKTATSYMQLSKTPAIIDLNLGPGINSSKHIYFKVNIPQDVSPNIYSGVISLTAIMG